MNDLTPNPQNHDVQTPLQRDPACNPLPHHQQHLLQLPSSYFCDHCFAGVAAERTQSVVCHPEHMSYVELGSTVAVDIVLGEGWGSTVQVLAVGTPLVLEVGRSAVVQEEAEDKVHSLVVVDLMDKVAAVRMELEVVVLLESKVEEDQKLLLLE